MGTFQVQLILRYRYFSEDGIIKAHGESASTLLFTNLSLGSPQCRSHQRLGTEILEDPVLIPESPLAEMPDTYMTL